MMKRFEAAFARWVVTHRLLILVLGLAALVALAAGARHLYFDSSYRVFFRHFVFLGFLFILLGLFLASLGGFGGCCRLCSSGTAVSSRGTTTRCSDGS